jgi:phosphoserine phosphatase
MSYVITAISHKTIDSDLYIRVEKALNDLPITIKHVKTLSKDRAYDVEVNIIRSESTSALDDEVFQKVKQEISELDMPSADLIIQKNDEFRKKKQLFCFDMDSTLIYQEVIELIAAYAGVEDEVEKITTAAMNGEIDFKQSLARRVKLLRGIDGTIWDELKKKLEFTKGDLELMKGLKKTGCKLSVLSGGFIPLANYVKDTLDLDYAFANTLKTEVDAQGKTIFSGETEGDIVDGEKKAELTQYIAEREGLDLRATVAVGDGSNDLKMMSVAGFGIAWNAKPKVQQLAPAKLNTENISDIFYILGYDDDEIRELTT